MKHILKLIIAIVVMMGGLAFVAPVANAATDPTTLPSCVGINTDIGKGDCIDRVEAKSSSSASVAAKVVSINGVDINSKVTVLANIKAEGTPKSQQTNCYRTPRAMSLYTSYNAEGTTGWHWKSYPKGYTFCKIDGKVRDPKCHNQVKIGVPKSNPPKNTIKGKVKFVKKFKFEMASVSEVSETVSAKAKSWCNTANTHAYGEGAGYAAFGAIGRASMKGSVLVKLEAAVNAASQADLAANLAAQGIVNIKAKAKTVAYGDAYAKASSMAVCQEQEVVAPQPPPPPPAPPVVPAPDLVEIDTINDVLVNNSRTITVSGNTAPNHIGTLLCTAGTGTISAGKQQSVSGSFSKQITYTAGSEPGFDQVTCTLTQDDGQKDTISTNRFEIRPAPVDPL